MTRRNMTTRIMDPHRIFRLSDKNVTYRNGYNMKNWVRGGGAVSYFSSRRAHKRSNFNNSQILVVTSKYISFA